MPKYGALLAYTLMAQTAFTRPALAQTAIQPLLDPIVLPDYNRGRNVSVAETPHADTDPLGLDLGSLRVFPSLTATSQANSNVFFNDFYKRADVATMIQPTVTALSDWSNAQLQIHATDQFRRDLRYTGFNRNTWDVHANGRIDLTSTLQLSALVEAGHFVENPWSSVVDGNFAALSQFDQLAASLRAAWTAGHLRLTAQADHTSLRYDPLAQAGTEQGAIDQTERDNHDNRAMVQGEYALSPGLAVYTQLSTDAVRYRTTSFGRNSNGMAVVSGFSLDWTGIARGALGLGYSHRNYTDGPYANPQGMSVQAKVEVFASPTTTLVGTAWRLLRDANSGPSVAYYDTHAQFDIDHALRENVLLSARLYCGSQQFVEDPRRRNFYQASMAAKWVFNRRLRADLDLGYSKSTTNGAAAGAPFGQFIGSVALRYGI